MFLKIGHRGAAGYEPENTLRSFNKALELGADMIELDVRLTRDKKAVVIHDSTVDRTTDGSGLVCDFSLKELLLLNAGKGEPIPSLEAVLTLLPHCPVNIEPKDEDLADEVLRIIRKTRTAEQVVISAFDGPDNEPGDTSNWVELLSMQRWEPRLKIALLTEKPEQLERAFHVAKAFSIFAINPHKDTVSPHVVRRAHLLGIKIFAWTVDEPQEIARLKILGVDGIFSNYPDRL